MENNKALTISLITIACLATVLALLWILRGWIMKLWDKMCECFGRNGEKEFEKVKDLDAAKIVLMSKTDFKEEKMESEIHGPPVVEQPLCVFVAETSSSNTISPQVADILRDHEERVREGLKKIDDEARTKDAERDKKYAQINNEIQACKVELIAKSRSERGRSYSSSDSGGDEN